VHYYLLDYGGLVGFRLAVAHPECVAALSFKTRLSILNCKLRRAASHLRGVAHEAMPNHGSRCNKISLFRFRWLINSCAGEFPLLKHASIVDKWVRTARHFPLFSSPNFNFINFFRGKNPLDTIFDSAIIRIVEFSSLKSIPT
jgi:hypothetical protein